MRLPPCFQRTRQPAAVQPQVREEGERDDDASRGRTSLAAGPEGPGTSQH